MMGHGLRGYKAAKHFETRLRFLHEHVRDKSIEFARIDTKNQLADGFTKAVRWTTIYFISRSSVTFVIILKISEPSS